MTVVVAARTAKDGIVIAADSEISDGWLKMQDGYPKVWVDEKHGYIFGACGSVRSAQVVKHHTNWPRPWTGEENESLEGFAVKEVVEAIQLAFNSAEWDTGQNYYLKELFGEKKLATLAIGVSAALVIALVAEDRVAL